MEKLNGEIQAILYDDVVSTPRVKVRKAIIRIGEAVLTGECPELDKSLGVVGRIKEMQAVPSIWCQRMCKKGAVIFIALRK